MDAQERTEVRNMIHDILAGWHAETVAREELINLSLVNIKDHLGRINGSVAKHEKMINENLPHTTANCAQKATIQEIRDNMISTTAVKKMLFITVGATASIASIAFILYQILK
jgi:hypothetical protein